MGMPISWTVLWLLLCAPPTQIDSFFLRPSRITKISRSILLKPCHSVPDKTSIDHPPIPQQLTPEQLDFYKGYLNQHQSAFLIKLVEFCSPIGADMAAANTWSGRSYTIESARLMDIHEQQLQIDVAIARRDQALITQTVYISLDAEPIPEKRRFVSKLLAPVVIESNDPTRLPIDDLTRRLVRFAWILPDQAAVSGKLVQLALQQGGSARNKLPENLYLNQVPHNAYVRQYFYDLAADAVVEAIVRIAAKQQQQQQQQPNELPATDTSSSCSTLQNYPHNRLQVICQFPELNPSMDSYRIGTLLELIRAMTLKIAVDLKLRVRVCVQGSMGAGLLTGVPKQLSGVAQLLPRMDWQSMEGEPNAGIVGNYVNFGGVGPERVVNQQMAADGGEIVQHQDDVFILIAPQSMIGTDCSIIPLLQDMVRKAGDRPVILVNADLIDKPSAGGQQSVRGRQERIDFAESFETAFYFQNIYLSGTSYFPILGAITKLHPSDPWIAHQRRDYAGNEGEIYVPLLAGETRPPGDAILEAFK